MHGYVVGIFSYLTWTSQRNRLTRQLRRMRQPRYALALLIGIGYIWFFFFRNPRDAIPRDSFFTDGTLERWASLGLLILFMRWWLFGRDRSALAFTPAEIQFLFTAPISRPQLIQYKLLRSQIAILISALIWVFLLGRGGLVLHPVLRALSLWGLFSFFTLHRLGATLVRTAATEHGTAGVRRNLPALIVFAALAGGLVWSAVGVLPSLRAATDAPSAFRTIDTLLQQPVPRALLAPFALLLAPTFARSAAEWGSTFPWVVLLLAGHYVWVVRSEAAFEDAAVEASAERARRIEAMRARRAGTTKPVRARGRPSLRLAPTGSPAGAIVWKNLVAVSRTPSSPLIAIGVVLGINVVILSIGINQGIGAAVALVALAFAGFSVLAGARFVRNDLRQDLLNVRLLRTYPIGGGSLVGAEVASATIVLTAMQIVLLVLAHVALLSAPKPGLEPGLRGLLLVAAVPVLVAVNAMTVTIQNAAALLFPAWVHLGLERTTGIEALGQNILTTLASLFVFALALIPPGIAGVLGVAGVRMVWPGAEVGSFVAGGVLAVAALLLEVGFAVMMLGDVFERGDLPVAGT